MVLPSGDCLAANAWFCPSYYSQDSDHIVTDLKQHVTICLIAMLASVVASAPLALLARRNRLLRTAILGITGVIYTIPSLALFILIGPIIGQYLGDTSVIIALTLYNLQVITRNTLVGLDQVPADVTDAALGMGFRPTRMLFRVELPLALPSIVTGLRIATVSTIALATVGIAVGGGGLGDLILGGEQQSPPFRAQIAAGLVLVVALGLVSEVVLLAVQRVLTPWTRARRA